MLGNPKRDRIAERREATQAEILAAAWEVARERGLGAMTLREVADRVGMRPPSLYSHFDSKHAVYDAMFGQAWSEAAAVFTAARRHLPAERRAAVRQVAHAFVDFAVADPPRHQLMNLRTIPGFEPSPESYAPAVAVLDLAREIFAQHGITAAEDLDLFTAIMGGLVDAQHANDPGGDRWTRLVDRAVDMYVDALDITRTKESAPRPQE